MTESEPREVPQFRCANCKRTTPSGLCGCDNAKPRETGKVLFIVNPADFTDEENAQAKAFANYTNALLGA